MTIARGRRGLVAGLSGLAALMILPAPGCEPYRIEYRHRPAYYQRMVDGPLPDKVVLDDGTILLYNTRDVRGAYAGTPGGEDFKIREEQDDGSVVLRAVTPEHVIANTLNCLRLEEYELLWDQMLSERTKLAYAEQGKTAEDFAAYCDKHRLDLARTLNRMLLGIASHDVVIEGAGNGVTVCRFWPQIASQFKFKRVLMVNEAFSLKLLLIQ